MSDNAERSINAEIRRLQLLIAVARYDYSEAVLKHMPVAYRLQLADEICEQERQKRCLETKNFKALPYNVKLLYNKK